jgi:hypothetical protein
MKRQTQMILTSVNLVAVVILIVLVLVLFSRLPVDQTKAVSEQNDQMQEINSVAFLANLCDEAGDECRPILYHPQGGEIMNFD